MIYKLVAAALLVASGEALKINAAGMSRRAAVAKAASLAVPLAAMPAFALVREADADLYKVCLCMSHDGSGPRARILPCLACACSDLVSPSISLTRSASLSLSLPWRAQNPVCACLILPRPRSVPTRAS